MAVFAGFDLGGTQLKEGLLSAGGRVIHKAVTPSPPAMPAFMELLASRWRTIEGLSPEPIRAAGIGLPGIYDRERKRVLQSPNFPALDGFDLLPALGRAIPAPFDVDNDANLAAYGEWKMGAGRGAESLVLLTIGTGIGGAIIAGGGLWRGRRGYAGELGHLSVNPEGRPCLCGNRGCLETEVSSPAIVRHFRELGGSSEAADAEAVHRRAAAGEEAARRAFDRAGRALGLGLGLIINILNPEKIILGGGVMSAGPLLLDPAIEEAGRRSFRDAFDSCAVVPAALGNDAGFMGAALWAADTAGREARGIQP